MLRLLLSLAGAAFVLGSSQALGNLVASFTAGRERLPPPVRFTLGAALFSLSIFVLLTCRAGYLGVYLAWGTALMALSLWMSARRGGGRFPALPPMPWFYRAVFGIYGAMYLVVALAPEIQPDAVSYHLRLVMDAVARHRMSSRIEFFDMLPQGLEMLFVPAYAVGGNSAPKLVHLAFLMATVPLLRHLCRQLDLPDRTGCAAAALFFAAPVCGVAGTSGYTDLGVVCCALSVFYLLPPWEGRLWQLAAAGAIAGFGYSVKQTFGWVAFACGVYILVRERKAAAAFAGGLMLTALPWMARASVLTGNPFAPFLNAWFPNEASTRAIEKTLASGYSAFNPAFHWRTALPDYAVWGGHDGLLGPAFLLLPLALGALRFRAGRVLLGASLVLALPMLLNTGTRFLLPALAPAAIALASAVPTPLMPVLVALQAVGSLPAVLDLWEPGREWRLRELPVAAAFGIEAESAYLARSIADLGVARFLADNTPAGARIFSFKALPEAYIPRELTLYWYSARAQRNAEGLSFASASHRVPAVHETFVWAEGRALRNVEIVAGSELRVLEAEFNRGGTRAESWKNYRVGESLKLRVPPQSNALDLLLWPGMEPEVIVRADGETLPAPPQTSPVEVDYRAQATALLRASGMQYVLVSIADTDAWSGMGKDMLRYAPEWHLNAIALYGDYWLFSIN